MTDDLETFAFVQAQLSQDLVARIRPLLAGQPPAISGAALADLLSIWLAGHCIVGDQDATDELREHLFSDHIKAVWSLVPANAMMLGTDQ